MITREQAIHAARRRVQADGVMSLDGRDTVAEREEDAWHVYFPFADLSTRGGEPHVKVGEDGSIVDIWYTQ